MFLGKHADVFYFFVQTFHMISVSFKTSGCNNPYPLTIYRQAEKKQTRLRMNNKLRNSFLYLISDD